MPLKKYWNFLQVKDLWSVFFFLKINDLFSAKQIQANFELAFPPLN